jgi:undecaprenyl-diphosphatase
MSTPLLESGFLGIVEGLTEFIPVSSTGHLILAEAFLQRPGASSVFDVFIQIGAIMAVIWVRRERVLRLSWGFFADKNERLMGFKIIAAFLPAAIMGIFLHGFIKNVLFSPWVVGVSLIVGGVIMLIIERSAPKSHTDTMDSISMKTAFGIGICQIASLIPGISRAGASIVGAQFLGVERRAATEFSFFLAIPTILGAAVFDMYENRHLLTGADIPIFAMGTVTAFISALFVVRGLIEFVGKHGFKPFGYYRIVLGLVVLILLYTGVLQSNI